ncbi:OprD family porin [Trinickia terrae]|uniref:OprD family porin n=1 Tax=Trinickia terrae TaxID=2571161 RepID=A0A4U1I357_9BURK|nr:OprD family outer membrane porin [Trinickia terrae]TKC87654.1 OprD family porin [Trinickia terrae]
MRKQRSILSASNRVLILGAVALAATSGAHAQNTPDAGTPDSRVDVEASQAALPPVTPSSQAKSKGLIAGSHLNFEFRNYSDYLHMPGSSDSDSVNRHAWVQGVMANFESGYTQGLIGLGFDASLYAAFKLDGGKGAGNMAHVAKGGGGYDQLAWAYPGIYDVKARISETVVKYGLQILHDNPFFEPHDNRALPPTFLGTSIVSNEFKNLTLQAGSFTKVDARGRTSLTDMTTAYGGTPFKRLSYIGGSWDYSDSGSVSLFANQADDVWRQYYASVQQSIGSVDTIKWTGFGNVYSTHSSGAATQGHIGNNAYSLSLSAQHGPHGILVGYQQILGDQFFDYVNETSGIYLVNSLDVDYNAPHEKSLQLRYTFDGKYAGLPGFKTMLWGATGWGADASAVANRYGANGPGFTDIYWRNGQPVHGRHHEFGIVPSYTLQSGRFKSSKVTLVAMWHQGSAYYSDSSNYEYRLVVTVPVKVF